MFKLGTKFSVLRSYRPAVIAVELRVARTFVDHGFDREAHPGLKAVKVGLPSWVVWDRGFLVKSLADSMADVLTNDRETPVVGFVDDCFANLCNATSRSDGSDRLKHAIEGALCKIAGHG